MSDEKKDGLRLSVSLGTGSKTYLLKYLPTQYLEVLPLSLVCAPFLAL